MPKYELSPQQVQYLRAIVSNAQIQGKDAPVIIELQNALLKPIEDKKTKE
jgi:hypothetical protein